MARRRKEHRGSGTNDPCSVGIGVEMEATCTGCDLVDFRGGSSNHMLSALDDQPLERSGRGGSMLCADWVRPKFDWADVDWCHSCMETPNGSHMMERRKAETIGELDTHLGYMMEELSKVTGELKEMRDHFNALVTLMATKVELEALREEVRRQSPSSIWKTVVWISAGVTALAGAFGVLVAVFRYLQL
jgi:hypothetical protein